MDRHMDLYAGQYWAAGYRRGDGQKLDVSLGTANGLLRMPRKGIHRRKGAKAQRLRWEAYRGREAPANRYKVDGAINHSSRRFGSGSSP